MFLLSKLFRTYGIHRPVSALERRFGEVNVVFTEELITRLLNPLAANDVVSQAVEVDNVLGLATQG